MFQPREREQSCRCSRIHEQIKVALVSVGAAQHRSEDARARQAMAANKLPQLGAVGRKCFGWLHAGIVAQGNGPQNRRTVLDLRTWASRLRFGLRPARGVPVRGNEVRDTLHEPARSSDRRACTFGRHLGVGAGLVVSERFEVVSPAKERPQLRVKAWIILDEPPELSPRALMTSWRSPRCTRREKLSPHVAPRDKPHGPLHRAN